MNKIIHTRYVNWFFLLLCIPLIIFILFTDNANFFDWIIVFILIIGTILLFFKNNINEHIQFHEEYFTYKNSEERYSYKYINELQIEFKYSRGSNITKHYCDFNIYYKSPEMKKEKIIILNESTYKKEYWNIISVFKNYNSKYDNNNIYIQPIIPNSESELNKLISGWNNQEQWVFKLLKEHLIQEYAKVHDISQTQAELEHKKLKSSFLIFLLIIFFIIFVIGTFANTTIQIHE